MNICPVLRPVERARLGILVGSDDQEVELLGLGRFGPMRRVVKIARGGLRSSWKRRRLLERHMPARSRFQLYPHTPAAFRSVGAIPPRFAAGLHGFEDVEGLGRLRLKKRLKKVLKSKAFKIAAIGTAAYFTGGAALKYGAPVIKKIAAARKARAAARQARPTSGLPAAPAPWETPGVQYPGAEAPAGGGGGFFLPSPYVTGPGEFEEGEPEAAAPAVQRAGFGGAGLLIAGGLVVALLAGRRR